MGYWKSKVLPKIKKVFENINVNKKAAAEACKSFDESKETINNELEAKKADLQPRIIEIYEASSSEIKVLVKEHTEAGVQKNSTVVAAFVEELVKIEFPGSKLVSDAITKYGPANVSSPVVFILEKVSTFLPVEVASPAAEDVDVTERGLVVAEEEKKEEDTEKKMETSTAPVSVEGKAVEGEATATATVEPEKPADG